MDNIYHKLCLPSNNILQPLTPTPHQTTSNTTLQPKQKLASSSSNQALSNQQASQSSNPPPTTQSHHQTSQQVPLTINPPHTSSTLLNISTSPTLSQTPIS